MVGINYSIQHIATHNGLHNHVKDIVMVLLYDYRYYYRKFDGLTRWDLVRMTGQKPRYLSDRLKLWSDEWHYLRRKLNKRPGREIYRYVISTRGKRYVEMRIPPEKRAECRDILKNISKNT